MQQRGKARAAIIRPLPITLVLLREFPARQRHRQHRRLCRGYRTPLPAAHLVQPLRGLQGGGRGDGEGGGRGLLLLPRRLIFP